MGSNKSESTRPQGLDPVKEKMTTTPAPAPVAPGALFGLPTWLPDNLGTQFFETNDSDVDFAVTINQSSVSTVNGLSEFTQDNITFYWSLRFSITQAVTAGTSTITTSPQFPFNYIGNLSVSLQSQYQNIQVLSGYMLYLFNLVRPQRGRQAWRNMASTNPADANHTPLPSGTEATNLDGTPSPSDSSTAIVFSLDLSASMFFDRYWDVDIEGNLLNPQPIIAQVSPQYMAGAARQVTPRLSMNPIFGSGLDSSPFNASSGTGAATASATMTVRRNGVYATNNPEIDPPIFNWQVQHIEKEYSLSGRSTKSLKLDEYGQITALILSFWDPSANSGLGAPLDLSSVLTKAKLSYGSALSRFDDTPRDAQRRFLDQHGFFMPKGVLVWDLAIDPDGSGKISNAYSLNTLVQASCTIDLTFSSALSSTAYVRVGYEMLKYVLAG